MKNIDVKKHFLGGLPSGFKSVVIKTLIENRTLAANPINALSVSHPTFLILYLATPTYYIRIPDVWVDNKIILLRATHRNATISMLSQTLGKCECLCLLYY